MIKASISIGLVTCCCVALAADGTTEFSPEPGVTATVSIDGPTVTDQVSWRQGKNTGSLWIEAETRKTITVDDYNFDGRPDFSVSYLDEGMGVHTVHRVFLYSAQMKGFIELPPACSNEFLDLRIDKKHKRLLSTYYRNNAPETCVSLWAGQAEFPKEFRGYWVDARVGCVGHPDADQAFKIKRKRYTAYELSCTFQSAPKRQGNTLAVKMICYGEGDTDVMDERLTLSRDGRTLTSYGRKYIRCKETHSWD